MTDLTGAELDAAVATAMGKQPQLLPDAKGVMHCMVPYPQDCAPDAMVAFRPSRGGAAAWEVLEWVMARYDEIWMAWEDLNDQGAGRACGITIDQDRQVRGTGPTNAVALCRAVVALGEAG